MDDCFYLLRVFLFNLYRRLGWDPKEGESHLDALLRGEILSALAQFGHSATRDEGLKRFKAFLNDRDTSLLPPDTRHVCKLIDYHMITKLDLLLMLFCHYF